MSTATELRLLFVVGIVVLAAAIVALALLARWLTRRIKQGDAWFAPIQPRDPGTPHRRQRLEHQLAARSARWRMLL